MTKLAAQKPPRAGSAPRAPVPVPVPATPPLPPPAPHLPLPVPEADRDLIALLQANARESTANLARRLGVARTTIVARLQRLERDGVIAAYTLRLGQELAHPAVQAHVAIAIEPKRGKAVVNRLQRLPELHWLASVSGEFDCVAMLRAPSTARLDALLDEIGEIDGVLRTQSSIVLAVKIDRS